MSYRIQQDVNKMIFAGIIHDLKSPIYGIVNMLNLILKGKFGELNASQYEVLKLISDSEKYVKDLVEVILSQYKVENYKIKLNSREFNFVDLVYKVCEQSRYQSELKGQKIIFSYDKNSHIVFGDELQLERVIKNLLYNALKYGLENTLVHVSIERKGNVLDFSITNKSVYMLKTETENFFKMFYTGKDYSDDEKSYGLGLSIVKRIIKLHHGDVYLKCSEDGIYTFGFKIKEINKSFQTSSINSFEKLKNTININ